jgi:hypothetical protein
VIPGKEEGFARKRLARDKANRRWVKNRHLVIPAIVGVLLFGGLMGGTIAMSIAVELAIYGMCIGAGLALFIFGPSVIKELCE